MTFYINDEIIEKVKESCDIVDIISGYVPLKRSGSNYTGLCPFHNEKTPSFTVSDSKQIFRCFGCGEGGDGVSFIMKKENLSFPEAIKFLAHKYGIEIEETNKVNEKLIDERNIVYEINKEVARFFYNNLTKEKNPQIYLQKRKIHPKVIRQFGLGFSIDSWNSICTYLTSKGYKEEDIEKTGLIGRKSGNNSYYDKFRNRVMFPIIDTKSRIVGFGGRVLDNSMPKYLNSQDTIVFNKGNHLYGLNLLSKYSDRKRILLVEGYMDVISLFSKGINYAVASLGTAFTERQARLVKRYGEEVYICYDSDLAGITATLKAIEILLKEEVNPRVVLLPNGMDPDDFINKKSLMEFEKLLNNAFNHIDFKIHINKKKYNLDRAEDKVKFTIEIAKIIKSLKSPVEQDVYIDKIALETGISKEAIEEEIKGKNFGQKKFIEKKDFRDRLNRETIKPVESILPSGHIKAEIDLIKLMLYQKENYEAIYEKVKPEDFSQVELRKLYTLISNYYEEQNLLNEDEVINRSIELYNLNKDAFTSLKTRKLNFTSINIEQMIEDLINTLLYSKLESQRKNIIRKIEEYENKTDKNEADDILVKNLILELTRINQEIKLI